MAEPAGPKKNRGKKSKKIQTATLSDHGSESDGKAEADTEYLPGEKVTRKAVPKPKPATATRGQTKLKKIAAQVPEEDPEHVANFKKQLEKLGNLQKSILNSYKKTIAVEQHELEQEQCRAYQLESENESLKRATFKLAADCEFTGESDDIVQENLTNLMTKIKSWVRKYLSTQPISDFSDELKAEIVGVLAARPNPFTSKADFETAMKQGVTSSAILNALVAKHLFDRLVNRPFFFLERMSVNDSVLDLSAAVLRLFHMGSRVNSNKANEWLSQTMGMLHPSEHVTDCYGPDAELTCQHLKVQQYNILTQDLLRDQIIGQLLKTMNSPEAIGMETELLSIISSLGQYLSKLHTRKVRVSVLSYDSLHRMPFMIQSDRVRPHPLLHLDSDDLSCDGNRILMTIQPGILAYGDEHGNSYDRHKVWCPAVVIVQKPVSNRDNSAPPTSLTPPSEEKPHGSHKCCSGCQVSQNLELQPLIGQEGANHIGRGLNMLSSINESLGGFVNEVNHYASVPQESEISNKLTHDCACGHQRTNLVGNGHQPIDLTGQEQEVQGKRKPEDDSEAWNFKKVKVESNGRIVDTASAGKQSGPRPSGRKIEAAKKCSEARKTGITYGKSTFTTPQGGRLVGWLEDIAKS